MQGPITSSSTTLNPYSDNPITEKFNVNYLKSTTAYEENIITLIDEFRSNAALGTPTYNSTFDFDLTSANNAPGGITFANNKFWVIDDNDNKVYSYSSSGIYDDSADFSLDSANGAARGLTFANNKYWIVDFTDNIVYCL